MILNYENIGFWLEIEKNLRKRSDAMKKVAWEKDHGCRDLNDKQQ